MKFIRDILFCQVETSGPDPDRDPIIQLSAILLDKDNLLEKGLFNRYVRVSLLDSVIAKHAAILGIPQETLCKSPKIYDAVKEFKAEFTGQFLLATHNFQTILFLRQAFRKSLIDFDYDQHILELWTLGYIYTLNSGMKKIPTFTTLLNHFNLKEENPHNALERCRLSAEIFRRIIKMA